MKQNTIRTLALTLCVLMLALCLAACGGKGGDAQAALVGTWEANEAEGCAYIFNEDGTGKWDLGGGAAMDFTYADKGDTVEITYEGASDADVWEYSIDGSTLTMKDTDTGTILTYTKK